MRLLAARTGRIAALLAAAALSACGSLIDSRESVGTGTIGTSGGTVVAGNAAVSIPHDALSSSTQISITSVPAPAPLPSGVELAGKVYAITPHGQQFSAPVTITLPLPSSHGNYILLTLPNPQATVWRSVSSAHFDGDQVSVQSTHFSFYAVGELAATCSDHNGGCDANAVCSLADGSLSCSCKDGYEGDGLACVETAAADEAWCGSHGANCGTLSRTDAWGTTHEASCGTCTGLESCGVVQPNICGCVGETDAELCSAGAYCGQPTVTDRCRQTRTPDCGGCASGQTCSCPASLEAGQACVLLDGTPAQGPVQNQCVCVSESDAEFCGPNLCVTIAGMDNCGQFRVVDCQAATGSARDTCEQDPGFVCAGKCGQVSGLTADGSPTGPFDCGGCPANQTCGALSANVCGCAPETDAQLCTSLNAQCGVLTPLKDNCQQDRVVNCGVCQNGAVCAANQCQCVPETDQQLCASVGAQCGIVANVVDNCGATRSPNCGTCANGACNASNQCPCVPESGRQLCTSAGAQCGTLTAVNNCGLPQTADCGDCASGATCGATIANVCGCVPESDAVLCAANGAVCGTLVATDNCGTTRTATCPMTCTGCGSVAANQCPCVPENDATFCAQNGAVCGSFTGVDNCGAQRTVTCGSCADGSCGVSHPNQCSCTPEPDSALCGSAGATCGLVSATDNCGHQRNVYCGGCPQSSTCSANQCTCVEESTDALCDSAGAKCGTVASIVDNCGQAHQNVDCGSCPSGSTCGHPNANVCSCVDEDPATFCARAGAQCGPLTGPDNCGNVMTVENCGTCAGSSSCNDATNTCSCIPETDQQLCASHYAQCGSLTAPDNCHVTRTVQCGSCTEQGDTCGAYWPNICGCAPESTSQFCAAQGVTCGWVTGNDNCGFAKTLFCGTCSGRDAGTSSDAGEPADGGQAGQGSDAGGDGGSANEGDAGSQNQQNQQNQGRWN
jgi:hypothetical protein